MDVEEISFAAIGLNKGFWNHICEGESDVW